MSYSASNETDTTSLTVSEARFACLFDTIQDGVIMFDHEGRVVAFNQEAERLFGWTADLAIGLGIGVFLSVTRDAIMGTATGPQGDRLFQSPDYLPKELLARHRDGSAFAVEVRIGETGTGGGRQFVAVVRDLRPQHVREVRMSRMRDQVMNLTRLTSSAPPIPSLLDLRQPVQNLAARIRDAQNLLANLNQDQPALVGELGRILDQAAAESNRINRHVERQFSGPAETEIHLPASPAATPAGRGLTDSLVFMLDDDTDLFKSLARSFVSEKIELRLYHDVDDFIAAMEQEPPQAIIASLRAGDGTGVEILRALQSVRNATPLFMIIDQPDAQLTAQASKLGIAGFFEKPVDADQVAACLAAAMRSVANDNREREDVGTIPGLELLTPRERDVLREITSGASNKEAGQRLGISSRTIEVHRARIMEKLGARNAADLVRIVLTSAVVL